MTVHAAFNGQVQFDCTRPNLKSVIVSEALDRDVMESALFLPGSASAILFSNLKEFLGKTRAITFVDIGLGEDAEALQAFWRFVGSTNDYRAIWDEFLQLNVNIFNEWLIATQSVVDPHLLAPAVVQPGAPSDEALEATGTDGAKKKKRAKIT